LGVCFRSVGVNVNGVVRVVLKVTADEVEEFLQDLKNLEDESLNISM